MESRRIGSLEVSVVGLGCNNFGWALDEAGTRAVVEAALDAGITLLDTADIYGRTRSETYLGRILEGRRDEVVIATKFGMRRAPEVTGGAAPHYIRRAVEASLTRLRTDRIDLYQLHEPDPSTPIADTLAVLDDLVRQGKVREIGCSNLTAEQLREAASSVADGAARFICVQNELSLLERADLADAVPEAVRLQMAYLPYFPLASGLLTGKYHRGEPPPPGSRIGGYDPDEIAETMTGTAFDHIDALSAFAAERGHTLLDLAFAWLLALQPVTSVIAGATRPDQIRANVAAGMWRLDENDLSALPA